MFTRISVAKFRRGEDGIVSGSFSWTSSRGSLRLFIQLQRAQNSLNHNIRRFCHNVKDSNTHSHLMVFRYVYMCTTHTHTQPLSTLEDRSIRSSHVTPIPAFTRPRLRCVQSRKRNWMRRCVQLVRRTISGSLLEARRLCGRRSAGCSPWSRLRRAWRIVEAPCSIGTGWRHRPPPALYSEGPEVWRADWARWRGSCLPTHSSFSPTLEALHKMCYTQADGTKPEW